MKKIFLFLFVYSLLSLNIQSQSNFDFEIGKNLDIYADLYKQLNNMYIDEIEPGELNKIAIDAMLKSLDPYTQYYPESEITDVRFMQSGEYGGVGATISTDGKNIIISEVIKGFSADKAGIKVGDIIKKIDGIEIGLNEYNNAIQMMRGPVGSEIEFEIERPYTDENLTFEIERENVKLENVSFYSIIDDSIAFVRVEAFKSNAAEDLRKAIEDLNSKSKITSVILDLRSNPGGLLHEAVNMLDLFIDKNQIVVETKGKLKDQNMVYKTRAAAVYPDMNIVVLINGRSASASEIVAGSLQDYDRGVIIGKQSFGKGLVQKVIPLSYNAQAKITVSKYFIPSGRCIQSLDYKLNSKGDKYADSLVQTFHTKAGRPVKDAGGILPDIEVDSYESNELINVLVSKFAIFDYATYLYYKNEKEENIKLIENNLIDEFIKFLSSEDFYKKLEDYKKIESLEQDLNTEFQELDKAIAILKDAFINDFNSDLNNNKKEIERLIRIELFSRYNYAYGKIETSLDDDDYVLEALKVLKDLDKYNSILSVK